jgi:hypothetical protein
MGGSSPSLWLFLEKKKKFNSAAVRHMRALLMAFSSTGEHISHTEQFRKTHAFGDRLVAREAMTGMHAMFIRT